jgi:fluoroacetyl-CoA thioesterase
MRACDRFSGIGAPEFNRNGRRFDAHCTPAGNGLSSKETHQRFHTGRYRMKETLKAGLEHVHTYRVPESKTVPHLYPEAKSFQEMPKVFATGYMVGLMEWACIEAMAPHMEPGEGSVGTMINVTHTAATPPGMTVTVRVRCIGVDGRRTVWEIEAKDDVEVIGKGTHERFAVDFAKFNARLAKKASGG